MRECEVPGRVEGRFSETTQGGYEERRNAAEQAQRLVRLWQEYGSTKGDKVYAEAQKIIEELAHSSGVLSELKEKLQPSRLVAPTAPPAVKQRKRRHGLQV